MRDIELLALILLAHLIGDFFLQWKSGIDSKFSHKWKAPFLYIHGFIHFFLLLLFVGFSYWALAAIIAGFHLIIDGIKVSFQNQRTQRSWFFIDQGLHLLVILITWMAFTGLPSIEISTEFITVLLAVIFLSRPASFIITMLMQPWSKIIEESEESSGSLPGAGTYIGMLERMLILVFILLGHWASIGFLMAAKSIFRFGDLTRSKDRRLTEYILIGTFISFATAILTGVIVNFLGN